MTEGINTAQNNTCIVTVPVLDLLRVTPFKGHDDVRYYLNGIMVTPYKDHALLVATNGHWMAIYESEDARTDKDRILQLPTWFIQQIDRLQESEPLEYDDDEGESEDDAPPRRVRPIPLTLTVASETSHLTISEQGSEELVKPGQPFIDGKFPEWKKVLPDPSEIEPGLIAPFAASYLGRLTQAVPDEYHHPLFCYHWRGKPDSCALFRFGNMPQLVIALMPRRDGKAEPKDWPEWLRKENANG